MNGFHILHAKCLLFLEEMLEIDLVIQLSNKVAEGYVEILFKKILHIVSAHYYITPIITIIICRYLSISTPGENDTVNFVHCLHKDGN